MVSIVYVLKNPGMPGLLKIGRTDRDDPTTRMEELYTTGVPFPFECVKAVEVPAAKDIERMLHKAFEPYRVNPGREFFRLDESQVVAILGSWPDGSDVTERTSAELDEDVPKEEVTARDRESGRRPNLNFHDLGIKDGEVLVFDQDRRLRATVAGSKKVVFRHEEMSLTRATNRALKRNDYEPVRPTDFWLYEDDLLRDLYEEHHGQSGQL